MGYTVTTHHTPNTRPRAGVKPIFFVCHVTEGGFDGAVSWLCNPAAQASADEVIDLAGSRVAVLNTPATNLCTWAVGNGNAQSISWENEGYSGRTHWPDSHYATLADRMIRAAAAVHLHYGVTVMLSRTTSPRRSGICGHGDMAHWFGGSDHYTCPGPTFDYAKLEAAIQAQEAPPSDTFQVRDDHANVVGSTWFDDQGGAVKWAENAPWVDWASNHGRIHLRRVSAHDTFGPITAPPQVGEHFDDGFDRFRILDGQGNQLGQAAYDGQGSTTALADKTNWVELVNNHQFITVRRVVCV